MVKNEYMKAYMEDKSMVVLKNNIKEMLKGVQNKRVHQSINDTVKFLCDIERDLSNKNMLIDIAVCGDCGKVISIENVKKYHNKVDPKSNCYGCFNRGYKLLLKQNDAIELENELYETIEQTKEETDEETDPARRALAERIKQFRNDLSKQTQTA